MRRFVANLIWFISALPDYILFKIMLHFPDAAQKHTTRRRTPKLCSNVVLYEPTSGSTGATKWIPYTGLLKKEFLRGINPWIVSLYLRHPGLFLRTHYWAVSPSTEVVPPDNHGKYGFEEDREYLSAVQRMVTGAIFCVPASIRKIVNIEKHAFITLLYLLADRNLGLISVWHPSFLLILLRKGTEQADPLELALRSGDWHDGLHHRPEPARAAEVSYLLKTGDYASLWKHLVMISCWDQARAAGDAAQLRVLFPRCEVEGKGLLATEGIITIPWKDTRKVAAIRSHTLYFSLWENNIEANNPLLPPSGVSVGKDYVVYLSSGNGLERYRLGDVVRCTGFVAKTPCFDFLHRSDGICDLRGEKLHTSQVEQCIGELEKHYGFFSFAMLIPANKLLGYIFLYDSPSVLPPSAKKELDQLLCGNYHYLHARNIGQLEPVRIRRLCNAMERYRQHRQTPAGGVKNPPLYIP